MQEDFHYYATYCAAFLAGFSHEESIEISYAAQLVDCCTKTFLNKIKGPIGAATTQSQMELMDTMTDLIGRQNITRIWSAFHFLPYDLYAYAERKIRRPRLYMDKFRLICKPNGNLVKKTVELVKGKSLAAVGLAMHVLADTWAHSYFAGTPSQVINNTNNHFFELRQDEDGLIPHRVRFKHNPATADDLEKGRYSNSLHQENENSIMNLGHGRAGHFPDYSFARYRYMPAWANYREILKNNPSDYYKAFCQMIYALKYLRGDYKEFELDVYAEDVVAPYKETIQEIIEKRQLDACHDWRAFGEKLSGEQIEAFDIKKYQNEYIESQNNKKENTYLGYFIEAAIAQKNMVANEIFESGNTLAGIFRPNDKKWIRRLCIFVNNRFGPVSRFSAK